MNAISIAIVASLAIVPEQGPVFDAATGYRVAAYRAVVPKPPPGVPKIDALKVARLIDRRDAVLIDVLPAEGGVRDPVTGAWRLAKPATSIAGAAWFPEAGRGQLDPEIDRWFQAGVARLHARYPSRAIVVFCLADCWMSWNAAWRLARAGYRRVLWFADGADGWREIGRTLVPVTPYPPASKAR